MLIGYARCSAQHQRLDRQIDALQAAGCDKIFQEKMSGQENYNRPELARAIAYLKTEDVLVVAEWDRATRSFFDGMKIIQQIMERGALIKVLDKPGLDLTTPIGRGLIALLSALAEDERTRINARALAGRKLAVERGVKMGRKFRLSDEQVTQAWLFMHNGMTKVEIARLFCVHPSTITRLGEPPVVQESTT